MGVRRVGTVPGRSGGGEGVRLVLRLRERLRLHRQGPGRALGRGQDPGQDQRDAGHLLDGEGLVRDQRAEEYAGDRVEQPDHADRGRAQVGQATEPARLASAVATSAVKAKPAAPLPSTAGGAPSTATATTSRTRPPRTSCHAVSATSGVPSDQRFDSTAPAEDRTGAAADAATPDGSIEPLAPPTRR